MKKLTEAIEQHQRGQKDPEEPWDEHDYEKFLKESDARTDKYMELLDKYGDSDEAEEKIAKEMGWERELTEEEAEEERRRIEEMNAACEAALNEPPNRSRTRTAKALTGFAPRTAISATRCNTAALRARLSSGIRPTNWALIRPPTRTWSSSFLSFKPPGVKLAGALDGIARGEGFTDACLHRRVSETRAGSFAQVSGRTGGGRAEEASAGDDDCGGAEGVVRIREGILRLMDELRGRA